MAQPPCKADQLLKLADDLLALAERVRLGRPSHRAVHDNEEEASRIADAVRAAFRGPSRATAPVLGRTATGAWF